MKRILYTFLLVLSISAASAQKHTEKELFGTWVFPNKFYTIVFRPDHTMSMAKSVVPGVLIKYTTDFSKTPAPVTMDMDFKGKHAHLNAQVQFVNSNTIKWTVFRDPNAPAPRNAPPTNSSTIVLTRQKNK